MRLHNASLRFDKSVLTDAYTGAAVGNGQLDATDFYKLDGASVRRRSISVSPTLIPPTRRVVRLGSDAYLIGSPSTDEWYGSAIRTKYVLHQTPGLATIKTVGEALAGTAGLSMYASREWNKDVPDPQTSSAYFNDYHVFISATELVPTVGHLVYIDAQWHICHAVHPSLAGFKDLVSHEIMGTVFETVTVSSKTYSAVTDAFTPATASVVALRLRWQEKFEYMCKGQEPYERGDETVCVLKSAWAAVKPSDTLALSDGTWRILSVTDEAPVFSLHCRRA